MLIPFFPSEIARLVLGYLKESKCPKAWETFLIESYDLQEYYRIYQGGSEYPTHIDGKSLIETLQDYRVLKDELLKNVEKQSQSRPASTSNPEVFKTPRKGNENTFLNYKVNQKTRTQSTITSLRYTQSSEKLSGPRDNTTSTPSRSVSPKQSKRIQGVHLTSLNFDSNTHLRGEKTDDISCRLSSETLRTPGRNVSSAWAFKATTPLRRNYHTEPARRKVNFFPRTPQTESLTRPICPQPAQSNIDPQEGSSNNHPGSQVQNLNSNSNENSSQKSNEASSSDEQSSVINQSIVVRSSEVSGSESNFTITTMKSSLTPQYENDPPPYHRAPNTNSPRIILSYDRSQIPSLSTPMKDKRSWTEEFASPKRKGFIPRRRLVNESPVPKQITGNDPTLGLPDSGFSILEDFLGNQSLAQTIANNINKFRICSDEPPKDTECSNSSGFPSLQDFYDCEEVIKDALAITEADPLFNQCLSFLYSRDWDEIPATQQSSTCAIEGSSANCSSSILAESSLRTPSPPKCSISEVSKDVTKENIAIEHTDDPNNTSLTPSQNVDQQQTTEITDSLHDKRTIDSNGTDTPKLDDAAANTEVTNCPEAGNTSGNLDPPSKGQVVDVLDSCMSIIQPDTEDVVGNEHSSTNPTAVTPTPEYMMEIEDKTIKQVPIGTPCQVETQIVADPQSTPTSMCQSQTISMVSTPVSSMQGSQNITLIPAVQNVVPTMNSSSSFSHLPYSSVPTILLPPMPSNPFLQSYGILVNSGGNNWYCTSGMSNNVILPSTNIPTLLPASQPVPQPVQSMPIVNSSPVKIPNEYSPTTAFCGGSEIQVENIENFVTLPASVPEYQPKNTAKQKKQAKSSLKNIPKVTSSNIKKAKIKNKKTKSKKKRRPLFPTPSKDILESIVTEEVGDFPVLSVPDPSPDKTDSLSAMDIFAKITGDRSPQSSLLQEVLSCAKLLAGKSTSSTSHIKTLDFDSPSSRKNADVKSKNPIESSSVSSNEKLKNSPSTSKKADKKLMSPKVSIYRVNSNEEQKNIQSRNKTADVISKCSKASTSGYSRERGNSPCTNKNANEKLISPKASTSGTSSNEERRFSSRLKNKTACSSPCCSPVKDANKCDFNKVTTPETNKNKSTEKTPDSHKQKKTVKKTLQVVDQISCVKNQAIQQKSLKNAKSSAISKDKSPDKKFKNNTGDKIVAVSEDLKNTSPIKPSEKKYISNYFPSISSDSDTDSDDLVPLSVLFKVKPTSDLLENLDEPTAKSSNKPIQAKTPSKLKPLKKLSSDNKKVVLSPSPNSKNKRKIKNKTENCGNLKLNQTNSPSKKSQNSILKPVVSKSPKSFTQNVESSAKHNDISEKISLGKRNVSNTMLQKHANESVISEVGDVQEGLEGALNSPDEYSKSEDLFMPEKVIKILRKSTVSDKQGKSIAQNLQERKESAVASSSKSPLELEISDTKILKGAEHTSCEKMSPSNKRICLDNESLNIVATTNTAEHILTNDSTKSSKLVVEEINKCSPRSVKKETDDSKVFSKDNMEYPQRSCLASAVKVNKSSSFPYKDAIVCVKRLPDSHSSVHSLIQNSKNEQHSNCVSSSKLDSDGGLHNPTVLIQEQFISTVETEKIMEKNINIPLSTDACKTDTFSTKKILPPPKKRIRPVPVSSSPSDGGFSPFSPFSSPAQGDIASNAKAMATHVKDNMSISETSKQKTVPTNFRIPSGKPKAMTEYYKAALPERSSDLPISPGSISSSSCTLDTFLARKMLTGSCAKNVIMSADSVPDSLELSEVSKSPMKRFSANNLKFMFSGESNKFSPIKLSTNVLYPTTATSAFPILDHNESAQAADDSLVSCSLRKCSDLTSTPISPQKSISKSEASSLSLHSFNLSGSIRTVNESPVNVSIMHNSKNVSPLLQKLSGEELISSSKKKDKVDSTVDNTVSTAELMQISSSTTSTRLNISTTIRNRRKSSPMKAVVMNENMFPSLATFTQTLKVKNGEQSSEEEGEITSQEENKINSEWISAASSVVHSKMNRSKQSDFSGEKVFLRSPIKNLKRTKRKLSPKPESEQPNKKQNLDNKNIFRYSHNSSASQLKNSKPKSEYQRELESYLNSKPVISFSPEIKESSKKSLGDTKRLSKDILLNDLILSNNDTKSVNPKTIDQNNCISSAMPYNPETKQSTKRQSLVDLDDKYSKNSPVRSFVPVNHKPKTAQQKKIEQNKKFPAGVKFPPNWSNSKISQYSTAIESHSSKEKDGKECVTKKSDSYKGRSSYPLPKKGTQGSSKAEKLSPGSHERKRKSDSCKIIDQTQPHRQKKFEDRKSYKNSPQKYRKPNSSLYSSRSRNKLSRTSNSMKNEKGSKKTTSKSDMSKNSKSSENKFISYRAAKQKSNTPNILKHFSAHQDNFEIKDTVNKNNSENPGYCSKDDTKPIEDIFKKGSLSNKSECPAFTTQSNAFLNLTSKVNKNYEKPCHSSKNYESGNIEDMHKNISPSDKSQNQVVTKQSDASVTFSNVLLNLATNKSKHKAVSESDTSLNISIEMNTPHPDSDTINEPMDKLDCEDVEPGDIESRTSADQKELNEAVDSITNRNVMVSLEDSNTASIQEFNAAFTKDSNAISIQDTNVISIEESNAASVQETNVASLQKSIAASLKESNAASVQESNAASVQESNAASVQKSNAASLQESNAASVQKSNAASVQESNSASVQELIAASAQESNAASVQESNSASVQESNAASVQESNSASVQESNAASVQESNSASVQELNAASVQESNFASVQESNAALVQESNSASVQESNAASIQNSNATFLSAPKLPIKTNTVFKTEASSSANMQGQNVAPVHVGIVDSKPEEKLSVEKLMFLQKIARQIDERVGGFKKVVQALSKKI